MVTIRPMTWSSDDGARQRARLDYRLKGEAEFDHVLVPTVPFEWRGRLELPRRAGPQAAET